MEFNIHKYKNRKFSKDKLTHSRIKLFLLKFDYEVYEKDLDFLGQIELVDDIINFPITDSTQRSGFIIYANDQPVSINPGDVINIITE